MAILESSVERSHATYRTTTPSKSGVDLIVAVPELESYADIETTKVVQTPSFDMDAESLTALAERTRTAVDDGTDDVVITHGTDTMEEHGRLRVGNTILTRRTRTARLRFTGKSKSK
ncbi:asparaginase domain-containing protein [Halococcus sp. AFM35]|uniref:asparaginase domain-containing protein n=1 Tax=Halococcus sp. AFM35 TaxID=3421653 RepID=UPI003EBE99C7